ncbi:MAG: hypothetical protein Q4B01_04665 [Eubacteriales bacterium]|nr:hypothetical protein [Eubacteriales bacterium]
MKRIRKTWYSLMAVMIFLILLTGAVSVQAAPVKAPKKVHISVQSVGSFTVTYSQPGDHIKNLKSGSKMLVTKVGGHCVDYYYGSDGSTGSEGQISLYAKKPGTYTVKFDVYNKNGQKRSSHKVKVYATAGGVIKEVKINGKSSYPAFTTASRVKVKIKLNASYKLKSLAYSVRYKTSAAEDPDADGSDDISEKYDRISYKKFSNGGIVKLDPMSSFKHTSHETEDGTYISWTDSLASETTVRVTYLDKITGETDTEYIEMPVRLVTRQRF